MTPIQTLLKRIHWDQEFSQGEFVITYYDRIENRIIKVPLNRVKFDSSDHFFIRVYDEAGELHSVPFHRIREVYKNGRLIWQRKMVDRIGVV